MKKVSKLERRRGVIMSEDEFGAVLARPAEIAGALLARNPDLKDRLGEEEDDPGKANRKNPFEKVWSDMFPTDRMPSSLALTKAAVCLEWFRRRYVRNRNLERNKGRVAVVINQGSGRFARETIGRGGGWTSSTLSLMTQEALLAQSELSTPEVSERVVRTVLNALHETLTDDPESLIKGLEQECVPIKVTGDSATMSDQIADQIFRLLELNAS